MSGAIRINIPRLRNAANMLEMERANIASERARLQSLESLRATWRHADNEAFMQRLAELERDMRDLEDIMQVYGDSILRAAAAYDEAQQDVISISRGIRR